MKRNICDLVRILPGVTLGLVLMTSAVHGQASSQATPSPGPKKTTEAKEPGKKTEDTPTSATAGEDAGNFTITSTIEFGYRGQRVDGDVNKFKSDLNYKAGPRLLKYSSVNQLCLTCHSSAHEVGAGEPSGPQHIQNNAFSSCTACHTKVHGSRSSPVFFR